MSTLSRRRFLGLAAGTGVAVAAGLGGPQLLAPASGTGELLRSEVPLPRPFRVLLPVPPTARPVVRAPDADIYEITQRVASAEILPGLRTEVWGYDGIFPGPTLESRRGRTTVVRHRNELPVPTVVHLHGGRTPAESDGYPTDLVLPARGGEDDHHHGMHDPDAVVTRGSREYTFPLDQRAAMLWYHDHRMDFTGPAVHRGLAGMHIVRDDEEDALPLPRGDRELPLMITDRSFDAGGAFRYPSVDPTLREVPGVTDDFVEGVFGDVVLVNGAPWPVHDVSGNLYRLRLLNASNARRYDLALDPPPPGGGGLVQIGSDHGLLDAPRVHDHVPIAPAERYDVLVDFGRYPPGSVVALTNRLGTGSTAAVMAFRVGGRRPEDARIPERLAEIEPLDVDRPAAVRDLRFSTGEFHGRHGWVINGRAFSPADTFARPRLGDVERWRLVSDLHHPVHLHLVNFRVLARGGGPPGPHDAGLKDTVDLRPAEAVEIAMRFDGYRGRFMFHCHNAEHEDMGMMANLVVT